MAPSGEKATSVIAFSCPRKIATSPFVDAGTGVSTALHAENVRLNKRTPTEAASR